MKATLTFNLPEEKDDHEAAIFGMDFALALWELKVNELHRILNDSTIQSKEEAIEKIYEFFKEMRIDPEQIVR